MISKRTASQAHPPPAGLAAAGDDETLGRIKLQVGLLQIKVRRRRVTSHQETLFITDAAINIFPDLEAKRDIVQNAIDLFTHGGLGTPRVAILSAVETVTPKIPSTIEAAALCKMAERGQITGGILDGPITPSARRQPRSKASNPQSPGTRKSSLCLISRRATCSRRI